MDVETFAEWLRRQGHRVAWTTSSGWFDRGPRVLMAFPWHRLIRPPAEELRDLLRRENAAALRFSEPEDGAGAPGYDVVLARGPYDLAQVSSRTRPKIRAALARLEIQPIGLERYAREGWALEAETRARQGRAGGGRAEWERMALAARDLPGFEAWGALVDGRLAASVMWARVDDCVTMLYQQSAREFWPQNVNNALTFAVTRTLIQRPGVSLIHYGLQGLDAPPSVDEFKLHLGYARRPVRQRVLFHPVVAPLANRATLGVLDGARRLWKGSSVVSKTEGLVRVFLEGQGTAASRAAAQRGAAR